MDSTFARLRQVAASFDDPCSGPGDRALVRAAVTLGPIAIPLCVRELRGVDPARRRWARALLAAIAELHEPRVRHEVHALLDGEAHDDAKIDALALLADLGDVSVPASFSDPAAIQRRSVEQLADHLGTPEDVASAAALVAEGLEPQAIVELIEGLSEVAPAAAQRLVGELGARVDVDAGLRGELRRVTAPLALAPRPAEPAPPGQRPSLLEVLRDPGGRVVIAIARRVPGQRRWRAMSVLIDEGGAIVDGWYDADCPPRKVSADVLAPLLAQGFGAAAAARTDVRRLVAAAARRAVAMGRGLPPAYYLGRDLLDLGDAHLAGQPAPDDVVTALGRAVDLLAAGDAARARPLLEHCVARAPDDAVAASSLGLCLCALGEAAAALPWLDRAARLEPAWPLHHWNLAAVAHQLGERDAAYLAMLAFLARSAAAPAARDAAHDDRVALARQQIAEHERRCRLERRPLPRTPVRARPRGRGRPIGAARRDDPKA